MLTIQNSLSSCLCNKLKYTPKGKKRREIHKIVSKIYKSRSHKGNCSHFKTNISRERHKNSFQAFDFSNDQVIICFICKLGYFFPYQFIETHCINLIVGIFRLICLTDKIQNLQYPTHFTPLSEIDNYVLNSPSYTFMSYFLVPQPTKR